MSAVTKGVTRDLFITHQIYNSNFGHTGKDKEGPAQTPQTHRCCKDKAQHPLCGSQYQHVKVVFG